MLALWLSLTARAEPVALGSAKNLDAVATNGPLAPTAWPPATPGITWPAAAESPDAVALGGGGPRKWVGQIGHPADAVLLAWFLSGPAAQGDAAARVTVTLADGRSFDEDIRADDQISPLDAAMTGTSTTVWPVGPGRGLGVHVVRNPWPTVAITSVTVEGRSPTAKVVLLAVEAVTGPLAFPAVSAAPPLDGFAFALPPAAPAHPQPDATRVVGPTGAHGFVTVRDGHLAFAEGDRVRFWGMNLVNDVALPSRDDAPVLAAQLAGMGVNLVRLHHFDSAKAGMVRPKPDGPLFDAASLDRFDYFVSELGKAGVYVLLETATNRILSTADGVSDPGPEIPNGHKLLPMFEKDWGDAYEAWARAWLGRTNPYTKKRYADDPVVAMVELTNEDSLLASWTSGSLEALPAVHRAALDRRWNEFLRARYGTDAAVTAAWTGSVNPGLRPGESLAGTGSIRRDPDARLHFRAWPTQRERDLAAFYGELEQAFSTRMQKVVRDLGYRVPIVGGISYQQPPVAQILSPLDVIDMHYEWDAGVDRNDSAIGAPRSQGLLDRLKEAQLDKPFIVSELNHGFPNDTMAEAPLFWATLAGVQDWDALIWFDYANGTFDPAPANQNGPFDLRAAVTKLGQNAVASALFRSGAVHPAPGLWTLYHSPAAVMEETVYGARPIPAEVRDVAFALGHRIREAYGNVVPVPGRLGAPAGDVGWWVDPGLLLVDTPGLEAVVGRVDRRGEAGHGEGAGPAKVARLDPRLDGFAAVSLAALDGQPLASSKRALLTVAGRMENDGMLRAVGGTAELAWGSGPARIGRPNGEVRFAWPGKPVVRPIAADGTRGAPLPVRAVAATPENKAAGWWVIDLATAGETMWWEIGG
jgi:hypothetical protein